jgi:hypothetical protein
MTRSRTKVRSESERYPALVRVASVLTVLWILGLVGGHAMGGFIHLLLFAAIVVLAARLLHGRRGRDARASI